MQTTPLDAAALCDDLRDARIGHTIVALGSVPSTMPVAAAAMDDRATRSGLVVTAEEQTAGRGRLGRSWQAPAGQALLMTVALKPPDLPQPLSRLPMLAAVALVEAIACCAPALDTRLAIKWPNDVLLQLPDASTQGDTVGKVAGILLESAFVGEEPAYALIGMGINVNQDAAAMSALAAACAPEGMEASGMKPTSLRVALGQPFDRAALLVQICRRLEANLAAPQAAMDSWRRRLITLGRPVDVRVLAHDAIISGVARDVDADGRLIVELAGGERRHFAAGDVTLRVAR